MCYAPARFLHAPFPDGLVAAVVSPRMSWMLHNLRIHQRFVAILLLPLVLLAATGRRPDPLERHGGRAGRAVNTLVIFTITLAGLAHELQKERDPSAVYLADNR
jgi:hypothetical protein